MTELVRRVLLVHGAWHGAWCWERVEASLQNLGFHAEALDLPGHGVSTQSFSDLHGDADVVRARLDAIAEPTLLVGHSYGGMVITDAGDHDSVAALVYVCAFVPAEGQSLVDTGRAGERPDEAAEDSELVSCTVLTDDATAMYLEGENVATALYGDCDEATRRWALARLEHQPTASFVQAPRRLAWRSKPTTYVICTEDRTIPVWRQRQMARNADRIVELTASHSPFLSVPDELADLLADAARVTH